MQNIDLLHVKLLFLQKTIIVNETSFFEATKEIASCETPSTKGFEKVSSVS